MKNGLAIDIGGTFTDVVLQWSNRIHAVKVLTSQDDPSVAVLQGISRVLDESEALPEDIGIVLHGTTLATNALIERRGAKTALLTTSGHRDILEMALENRFEQYDINIERPVSLVPRELRLPITERMNSHGSPLIPLDMESVDAAIDDIAERNIESVAVGLLHSYVNNSHEKAIQTRVHERLGDIPVSLSSDVCPEIREYERLSTTCANAYVLPLMSTYLARLSQRLEEREFRCPYLMMTSGGGLTTFETARRYPIRLVESGPAGGAILAEQLARELDANRVLSFDMGGTTAKICLVDDGQTLLSRSFEVDRVYRFKKGSGLPVRIPVIEMVEIGAGGGSIARVDKLGRIQIGPESAGSQPGPACYGLGGLEPTVTDADCFLGRLDAERFAGGNLSLQVNAAESAIRSQISGPLRLDTNESALGMAEIVDENMAAAARSHAAEWGKSLEGRMMVAFGGAAPLHAARLMEKLDLACVLIPEHAGVGSAIGFLGAPISYEVVRSRHMSLAVYDQQLVDEVISAMREEASGVVSGATHQHDFTERGSAFMRYVGQGHEVSVTFDPSSVDEQELLDSFEKTYTSLYGRTIPNAEIEVISWTLNVSTNRDDEIVSSFDSKVSNGGEIRQQELLDSTGVSLVPLQNRDDLSVGEVFAGPRLVTERHTTTVVPGGFQIRRLDSGHLLMERHTNA
ncbi:MAG: hydantoinase/oxoprolinase family protein [Gammaproteobacteria bacterium]|nr:hydantoinase/oxoprolinase family protein [Gammaproteobacteria bacterium]